MTSQVLESVVKNCGQTVHDEVASKQTMEELKDLLKVPILQCICILPVFFFFASSYNAFSVVILGVIGVVV